ncbi:hypothetical protein DPMN_055719 [Dreissena polymorpha]|uniref:Uncharacterized protein n=1 Tax=Dreissena polymorpha TaxID=45954 RepID=A0A9D4CT66_DREPO|nr:hypothetical protein DPMN_055719 [Dreissena polymorpha]
MNLLSKFHEDLTINVASREKCPAPWQLCFQENVTIFKFIQEIIDTNFLTKYHDDWAINVASRVLTRKNATPPDIIGKNLLTKIHEDRKINVTCRVLTRKNAPPPGGRVCQPTGIMMNLLTQIHEYLNVDAK